jgi:hypothetical protein
MELTLEKTLGTILTKKFLCNVQIGPISWIATLPLAGKAVQGQILQLIGPLFCYEENEGL